MSDFWRQGGSGLAVFVLALAALLGLGSTISAQPSRRTRLVLPTKEDGHWVLRYTFVDSSGEERDFECRINVKSAREQEASQGFTQQEWEQLNQDLAGRLTEEARREGVLAYGQIKFVGMLEGGWKRSSMQTAIPDEEYLIEDFRNRVEEARKAARSDFFKRRGYRLDEKRNQWVLDYQELVARAGPSLKGCVEALGAVTGGSSKEVMAFFQRMPYGRIEDEPGRRQTSGFRVPASVLLKNEGDCDSKAVAFCVLQRGNVSRLVLFKSAWAPGERTRHALIGTEAYPGRGKKRRWQDFPERSFPLKAETRPTILGFDEYDLIEVAGPGETEFGFVAPKNAGDYWLVPIRTAPGGP